MRERTNPEVDHAFEVIRKFIASHTAEEIYRGAQERKFPWGVVRSPDENLDDPHFYEDRGFFEARWSTRSLERPTPTPVGRS